MTQAIEASADVGNLREVYLLRDLTEGQLAELMAASSVRRLEHDEWLATQGEPAASFFVVRSGRLALFRHSEAGQEKIIAVLDRLETFAEGAACLPQPVYTLSARAVGDVEVLVFPTARLRRLLEHSAKLCLSLLAVLRQREQFLLDEIDRLSLQNASQRVVAYLLAKAEGAAAGRVELDLPKSLLASQLSVSPETLSRILSRLKDQNMVAEEGSGRLVILDPARLQIEYRCFLCGGRSWGCAGPVLA
jgi:CRP-like cAMP-binding protein